MKPVNAVFTVELLNNKVYRVYANGEGSRHLGIPSIRYVNIIGVDVPSLDEIYDPSTKKFEYKTKVSDHLSDIRDMRKLRIEQYSWAIDRHIHERELGLETSLTTEQYQELLEYIQSLRTLTDKLDMDATWAGYINLPWPEMSISLGQKLQK